MLQAYSYYILMSMHLTDSVLRDFLIDTGLLSRGQVDDVVRQAQDKPLSRALIDGGILSEDEVRRAAAHALGVPFVILGAGDIDDAALEALPEPLCRAHNLAAYRAQGDVLEVALLNIEDLEALEPLYQQLRHRVVPRLTTRDSLRRALVRYQKLLKERFGDKVLREQHPHRLLEVLLRHAAHQRASEIHLEVSPRGTLVRYRLGHALHEAMLLPPAAAGIASAVRSLANTGSKTLPQEGRFKADLGSGVALNVRVSSMPLVGGEKLVLRLLPEGSSGKGFTLEGLGLHGAGAAALRTALHARSGLIVVAGARGSGRTTLLYTMLDMLNDPGLSLASVEERVAMRLPYVAQTQASPEEGLSMASALRAALRQDPNIVMLDGIEDRDTLTLALSAAARGMLVLASTEAPDAKAAMQKLRALGASDKDLAAVRAVVSTALVRKLCDKQTRDERPLERRHLEALENEADFAKVLAALKEEELIPKDRAWKELGWARVTGCSECEAGYRGTVGLFEVSTAGEAPLNLIEDALFKAAAGITSVVEALRFAEGRGRA